MISGPAYPHTARLQSQAAAFIYRPRLVFHFAEPEEAEPSASAFSSSMLGRGGVATGYRKLRSNRVAAGRESAPVRCLSGCHEGKRNGAPRFLGPNSNLLVVLHELAVAGTAISLDSSLLLVRVC